MAKLRFDRAQKMSWNDIPFPVRSLEIVGAARHHLHEYPHQPGADLEKLGRKPYIVRATAIFDEGIRGYGQLYPDAIEQIMTHAEEELTAKLVTPQAGSIQAYMTSWPRKWTADVRSGETMDLEWVEDQAVVDLSVFGSAITMNMLDDLYTTVVILAPTAPEVPKSLWDMLKDAVNSVLAFKDQLELQANLFAAKLEGLKDLIGQIDAFITQPIGYQVVQALADLWNAADSLVNDVAGGKLSLRSFTVPKLMDAMQVAQLIFGRTDRAMDILQMNAVDDALAIPAGTVLRYVADPGTL